MRKFKVIVEGRNVLIRIDEAVARMGFYATRLIESNTPETAKQAALNLIRMELMDQTLNARANPPVFVIEDAFEVLTFDTASSYAGFTWYRESEGT